MAKLDKQHKPGILYRQGILEYEHAATIEKCCDYLPSHLTLEDRLLFIKMIDSILNIPTEFCYQYDSLVLPSS